MLQNPGEQHNVQRGSLLRDFILGAQDGLVNVLGLILGVAVATTELRVVIVAGLAATFAESISMAAVAYTSSKAARDYYRSELEREKREMKELPEIEKKEIRDIYHAKGFRGKILNQIVKKITSNKKVWLDTMMVEELKIFPEETENPKKSAAIVGLSSLAGSVVPLIPFAFLNVGSGIIASIILSLAVLFAIGVMKAKVSFGKKGKSGLEMALIGGAAVVIGYIIGILLGGV
ncbi:MAG TPA: VIT1/CCC1 transporter family protein [archaeon]|nr:VIT1/CCC1 transporter family protein [archaeon]